MRHKVTVSQVTVEYDADTPIGPTLDMPAAVLEFLAGYLEAHESDSDSERFGYLALDSKHRLLSVKVHSIGTKNMTPVDGARLWRDALMLDADGLILFHTHPTGDRQPSRDDCDLTRRMVRGGALLGVSVLDHIIMTGPREGVSLRQLRADLFTAA